MLKPTLCALLALTVASAAGDAVPGHPASAGTEFVGSTPCGEDVRPFLGISNAVCQQISWELALAPDAGNGGAFELRARYHMPIPGSPNHLDAGTELQLNGVWTSAPGTGAHKSRTMYTLTRDGRSLRLALFERDLLHFLSADNRLMVGNAGWSYTLNRRDASAARALRRMEAIDAAPAGMGGEFEGRTPCQAISRELKLFADAGCTKLKWGLTLFQDAAGRPSTYKQEGPVYRDGELRSAAPRTGRWGLLRDASTGMLVYRLDTALPGVHLLLLRADENILFFLDRKGALLVGDKSFSYTLNSTE